MTLAQQRITIDNVEIKQPIKFDPQWETTYSGDTGRPQNGVANLDPMFTAESFAVEFHNLTASEVSQLLQLILSRPSKPTFQLHYFSWYYGTWRTDKFYVGKGSLSLKTLKEGEETFTGITCNMIGVNPVV